MAPTVLCPVYSHLPLDRLLFNTTCLPRTTHSTIHSPRPSTTSAHYNSRTASSTTMMTSPNGNGSNSVREPRILVTSSSNGNAAHLVRSHTIAAVTAPPQSSSYHPPRSPIVLHPPTRSVRENSIS